MFSLGDGQESIRDWYLAPHAAHPKGPKGAKMRIRNRETDSAADFLFEG